MTSLVTTEAFLARASRCVPDGAAVFAGFNWPILTVRVARRQGRRVHEFYEAGAEVEQMPDLVPSSSTDYDTYSGRMAWRGTSLELLGMVPRLDVVLLDASAVDLRGCVNSFGEGTSFRSAGGGGSADVAARARRLVLLHGGTRPARIVREVSAVTAAPHPEAEVLLVTRWGNLRLGEKPALLEVVSGAEEFVDHLRDLGADISEMSLATPPTVEEIRAAGTVLAEAGPRGYRVGRK
jgi:glutaconate CoA-transferase subunit B